MSVKTVADSYWTQWLISPQQVCGCYVHEPSDRRWNKVNMMNRHHSDRKRVILLKEALDLHVWWRPRALDPEESVNICVPLKVRKQQVSGVTSNCCDECSKQKFTCMYTFWMVSCHNKWFQTSWNEELGLESLLAKTKAKRWTLDYSRIITNFFKLKVQNMTSVSICSFIIIALQCGSRAHRKWISCLVDLQSHWG